MAHWQMNEKANMLEMGDVNHVSQAAFTWIQEVVFEFQFFYGLVPIAYQPVP
jgi:hypothetical protein